MVGRLNLRTYQVQSPACIRDLAFIRDPASISTIYLDPRLVSGTRRLCGTRLLSEVLRYVVIGGSQCTKPGHTLDFWKTRQDAWTGRKRGRVRGNPMVTLMMMIMDITLGIYLVKKRIHRAYSMLGLIKRNFIYLYLTEEALVTLFKSLVRCHLKNANSV